MKENMTTLSELVLLTKMGLNLAHTARPRNLLKAHLKIFPEITRNFKFPPALREINLMISYKS